MVDELSSKLIISLMSGTSCDSIDVGLCEVKPDMTCNLLDGLNYKYPQNVREDIFKLFAQDAGIKDVCRMNFVIGKCFADAANAMIKRHGKPDLIASHGQTIYHDPRGDVRSTLQIGESSVIAQETGVLTVSNFREADMAQNGNGAPLVCFADEKWFRRKDKNVAVQNIGGISNVTIVSHNYPTFGFDCGLGNIMIDYCTNKIFNRAYDHDGEIAAEGNVCESWLNCLLEDEYYFMEPPKTTGREYFSSKYIENALKFAPSDPKDIIATVTALTAKTIVQAYERFVFPQVDINEVIIGGGGAYNKTLMKMIRKYLPKNIELKTHEDYGISNNFKEVMAFALLGYCTYYNIPNNVPSCTGADKKVVLGKLTNG